MKLKIMACVLISALLSIMAGCSLENELKEDMQSSFISSNSDVSLEDKDYVQNSQNDLVEKIEDPVENTQKKMIIEINGQKYIWTKTFYKLLDNYSEDNDENLLSYCNGYDVMKSVLSDNILYTFSDYAILYQDLNNPQKSVQYLFSGEQVYNRLIDICLMETSTYIDNFGVYFSNFVDGGDEYLYFIIIPSGTSFNKCLSYRIGRFDKSGTTFELLNDVRASSMTISNGIIYYFDNGFDGNSGTINEHKAGLYCMSVDGNNKEKLLDIQPYFIIDKLNGSAYNYYDSTVKCMNIIGDRLYYIYKSKQNDSSYEALYSLDYNLLSNSKISSGQCSFYYVDTSTDMLYYGEQRHELKGFYNIVSKKINSDSLEKILIDGIYLSDSSHILFGNGVTPVIDCRDGYLYFCAGQYVSWNDKELSNESENDESKNDDDDVFFSASRYNLLTGKRENLTVIYFCKAKYDDIGFKYLTRLGYEFSWDLND